MTQKINSLSSKISLQLVFPAHAPLQPRRRLLRAAARTALAGTGSSSAAPRGAQRPPREQPWDSAPSPKA